MRIPLTFALIVSCAWAVAQESSVDTSRGDKMITEYFRAETEKLRDNCLADVETLDQWSSKRKAYRRQLLEMLGLDPLPERTDLKATVTGIANHDEFNVENVQFQSRPGLYVTGNLYVPHERDEKLPAILYVCGHGRVKKNGISYGNKVHYQHHGAWFARNGYVCLTIDTLQLGEIEGLHHGTYNLNMFWWLNRGYTSAGVEAWNCVRALDYLQSREEVDPERIGVTGRSGGGAYSWWIAAVDERIKVAVPVAGITDLENHVIDGTVEGHCDCMFMVNTYQWDYAKVAALVAPRPLLISNTDRDGIFPLDGVVRTHAAVRKIYELYGVTEDLALQITAGPHKDTQELRVHAFRWFNHHLKDDDELITKVATKMFEPEDLKVFDKLPADQKNAEIQESFTKLADSPALPSTKEDWEKKRDGWLKSLNEKSFRAWPDAPGDLDLKEVFSVERHDIQFRAFDFTSQGAIRLRLYLAHGAGLDKPDLTVLNVLDEQGWNEFLSFMQVGFKEEFKGENLRGKANEELFKSTQGMFKSFEWAMAYVAPRGIGPTAWDQSERKQTQHRRRFYLLGQSLDGMRIWDVQQAARALRSVDSKSQALWLQGYRRMAGVTLHASLHIDDVTRLDLHELPTSHREGPFLLNVRRHLDTPEVVAMAAENSRVVIYQPEEKSGWDYPTAVVEKLGWDKKQLQIRKLPESD